MARPLQPHQRGVSDRALVAPSQISVLSLGVQSNCSKDEVPPAQRAPGTSMIASASPLEHVDDTLFLGHLPSQGVKGTRV